MKTRFLDGRVMTDRVQAHEHIARQLDFPDFYGKNLDALFDLLSVCDEMEVVLREPGAMLNALGAYGCRLLVCFFDAAEDNFRLRFTVE